MYTIGREEIDAATRTLESMNFFRYGAGHEANAFEAEWAKIIGSREAAVVTSGTAALHVALQALGIGPGDSVLVPAYTYIATPLAVTAVGAIPLYVEVDENLTLDAADAARKVRRHTKAVIPVHMNGMPCDMRAVRRLARQTGVAVIEDCCQAAGGRFGKKRLGAIGDLGTFSFNQYKIISCGEGGAVTVNRASLRGRVRGASDGGLCVWEEGRPLSADVFCATNYRFNNLNAAVLREQTRRLDRILGDLRRTRARLRQGLRLPAGCRLVDSHDEAGDCGVCFLLQAATVEQAVAVEEALEGAIGRMRPINSGRHVYANWTVINEKHGGHHPDWDCFKHPKNQRIRTAYDRPLRQTDNYLARTVLCHTPYGLSAAQARDLRKEMNRRLRTLA